MHILIDTLKLITLYNKKLLEKYDGDQGAAIGLITFVDETHGIDIWNPFYDSTLRFEVIPTEEYNEQQLQSMVNQLHPKEEVNTAGHRIVNYYKVKAVSEVKCIGVTDDCIVGYAQSEPYAVELPTVIWVEHLQEEVNRYV